jgi:hypothetical protein
MHASWPGPRPHAGRRLGLASGGSHPATRAPVEAARPRPPPCLGGLLLGGKKESEELEIDKEEEPRIRDGGERSVGGGGWIWADICGIEMEARRRR